MLDTGYSIFDDLYLRISQDVIENRISSISKFNRPEASAQEQETSDDYFYHRAFCQVNLIAKALLRFAGLPFAFPRLLPLRGRNIKPNLIIDTVEPK